MPVLASDYKKKMKSINNKIDIINSKINKLKQEKSSLLNEIYEIELKYDRELIENNKVNLQLKETGRKINEKEKEKKELERQIEGLKKKLKKIIRILYKIGGNTYLKVFLHVETVDQLFKNYRMFVSLIHSKTDEINKLKKFIFRLNKVRKQLQEEYSKLHSFKQLQVQKMKNIKSLKQGKLYLIRKISNDKKKYMQLLKEIQYEAARLNEVISGKKVKSSLRVVDIKQIMGHLRWPINGRVISFFGKKKSAKFNTYVLNIGIEIRPLSSSKIKAVYSGDVIFADYYKGYGKLVIIQHSRDLYTFYGHCDKIFKKIGDSIMVGEVIANAGDTGSTYGKSLYFAIRKKMKFENPMVWLHKRR